MQSARILSALTASTAILLLAGCRTVHEGPTLPPDPNAQTEIRGEVPKPAPIPQKNIPPGESPLRHDKPDQRIDKPNG